MSEFKLLIFDWDGTLSDSLERIVTCLQIAADDVGLPIPTREAGTDIIGLGLQEALAQLFPAAEAVELESMRASYSRHYVELDQEPPPFYETVLDTLESLRSEGYLLAVATGKSRKGLDRIFGKLGFDGFFHDSRCADEARSKPHPLMLQQLLERFEIESNQACMVGDTEFDMEMAVRAQMPRIGVSYGAHSADRLAKYQLRSCVDRFSDILKSL